jgi:hypothetical protein
MPILNLNAYPPYYGWGFIVTKDRHKRETMAGEIGGIRWRETLAGESGGKKWRETLPGEIGGKPWREKVAGVIPANYF